MAVLDFSPFCHLIFNVSVTYAWGILLTDESIKKPIGCLDGASQHQPSCSFSVGPLGLIWTVQMDWAPCGPWIILKNASLRN